MCSSQTQPQKLRPACLHLNRPSRLPDLQLRSSRFSGLSDGDRLGHATRRAAACRARAPILGCSFNGVFLSRAIPFPLHDVMRWARLGERARLRLVQMPKGGLEPAAGPATPQAGALLLRLPALFPALQHRGNLWRQLFWLQGIGQCGGSSHPCFLSRGNPFT